MRSIRSEIKGRPLPTVRRAPCIYFNATPGNKIIEASIAQLASYVPSRREWKAWDQGSDTSIVADKFVEDIRHDIVAEHVTLLVNRDQDVNVAIVRGVEVKERCMREGRSSLSVKLHVGKDTATPLSRLSEWGVNHLEINVVDLNAKEVSDQIFLWIAKTVHPTETLFLMSLAELQRRCGCKVADRPEYRIKTIAQRYDHFSRPAKVHTHAVVLEKAVTHPKGKKLTISVADRTGSAKFFIEVPSTVNEEDLLADHSPNTNPLPNPPKVPASSTKSWNWALSLQPGQLVCFSSSPPVEVVESKTTSALKLPLRLLGGTVGVTGYAIVGVGKLLQKAADKLMMGQPKTMVPRADAIFMNQSDQRLVLGKRNGTPRWMRRTDVARGRAKEWKKIQKWRNKHCPSLDSNKTPRSRQSRAAPFETDWV